MWGAILHNRRYVMKIREFMRGRYGFDTLFFAITALCLLIVLLCRIFLYKISFLSVDGILGVTGVIMIAAFYRVFSRNIAKRQRENIKFTLWLGKLVKKKGALESYTTHSQQKPKSFQKKQKSEKSSAKGSAHGYGCCVKCGEKLQLPTNAGLHMVICPKCKNRNFFDNR